jgi:hypothetical protein
VTHHDRVHNAHRHPAEFGEDERQGQGEDWTDLMADGHGLGLRPGYWRKVGLDFKDKTLIPTDAESQSLP